MTSTSHASCTSSHRPAQIRLVTANGGQVSLPGMFMAATDAQPSGNGGQKRVRRQTHSHRHYLIANQLDGPS